MKKFSWKRFSIALIICIALVFLGRWSANYTFKKELGSNSTIKKESTTAPNDKKISTTASNDISKMEKEYARIANRITIKKEYSVEAEVFRIVDNYYKDAHRKETITIVVLSNGITMMKKHFSPLCEQTSNGWEEYSSLPNYEYQCFSIDENDSKVYAYNEVDKRLVKSK